MVRNLDATLPATLISEASVIGRRIAAATVVDQPKVAELGQYIVATASGVAVDNDPARIITQRER
jgi:hypothetical protein